MNSLIPLQERCSLSQVKAIPKSIACIFAGKIMAMSPATHLVKAIVDTGKGASGQMKRFSLAHWKNITH